MRSSAASRETVPTSMLKKLNIRIVQVLLSSASENNQKISSNEDLSSPPLTPIKVQKKNKQTTKSKTKHYDRERFNIYIYMMRKRGSQISEPWLPASTWKQRFHSLSRRGSQESQTLRGGPGRAPIQDHNP